MRYCLPLIFLLFSCGGDKLHDEYDILEGKYSWVSTGTSDGSIFSNDDPYITPERTGYTCAIEFSNDGRLLFYQNDEVINDSKYTILEKDSYDEHSAYVQVKLKSTDNMEGLTDSKLVIRLSLDTNLTVNRFPFFAIDNASEYYQDHTSVNNSFVRKN